MRDLLFVDDLVDALLLAHARVDALAGRAFNLGGGPANAVSLRRARRPHRRAPPAARPAIAHADWRTGDQRYYVVGHAPLRRRHRLAPRASACDEGLRRLGRLARKRRRRPAPPLLERGEVAACRSRSSTRPGPSTAASTSAAASRTCRSSSATRRRCCERAGHEALLVDGHLDGPGDAELRRRASRASRPDMTVVTTAPSYLFWRCAPPELRVPRETLRRAARRAAAAPSRSVRTARRRRGRRCASSASTSRRARRVRGGRWPQLRRRAARRLAVPLDRLSRRRRRRAVQGGPHAADLTDAAGAALAGRVDRAGTSIITTASTRRRRARAPRSRPRAAAPTTARFCAKDQFPRQVPPRRSPRCSRRSTALVAAGRRVRLLHRRDLPARPRRCSRRWSSAAGRVRRADAHRPVEAARCSTCWARPAASRSRPASRASPRRAAPLLDKNCKLSTDELAEPARSTPSGACPSCRPTCSTRRRRRRTRSTRWRAGPAARTASGPTSPVPLFPYPGSPDYRQLWGAPDDRAWERAHDALPRPVRRDFSDIQDERPLPLDRSWSAAC